MRNELLGILLLAILSLGIGTGCASMGAPGATPSSYFGEARQDGFGRKISEWQQRADVPRGAMVSNAASAADTDFATFAQQRRRQIARDLVAFSQKQAETVFVEDGGVDHWATVKSTLRRGQEDCDGLELLVFAALRKAGFDSAKVYRAIVVEGDTLQHHMVTLWFEDPRDPWVLDSTGAMTDSMVRMSEVPSWSALRVFTETKQFTVQYGQRS